MAALDKYRKTAQRSVEDPDAHLPPWWRFAQVAGGIVLVGFLAVSVIAGDKVDTGRPAAGTPVEIGLTPVTLDGEPAPTPGETTGPSAPVEGPVPAPPETGSRMLMGPSGEVAVPGAAVDVAERAAVALFTGDFSGIPIADPTAAAAPAISSADAAVLVTRAATVADDRIGFSVDVDPDGELGAGGARTVAVTVVLVDGVWALTV